MVDWLSLTFPLAYLGILIGSLATFASLYRKNKAAKSSTLKPWFGPHLQRDIYLSLLHLEPTTSTSGSKEKKTAVPETVLKAALLRRATEDINRLIELRNQKPALAALLQKGSVGDDLWQRFLRAEKEMEEEVRDVVSEANAFTPGWGQVIFQSANEMAVNAAFRQRIEENQSKVQSEREWWDKKKAGIKESFMKELEEEGGAKDDSTTKDEKKPSAAPSAAPSVISSGDDDTVLVESGGPAVSGGSGGGGGGKKKKKGKK
ncbi:hypothetical protein AJ80_04467 [Polytolypa hystricis UAMH7299]|uniref:Translocation protein sec66 n=1 Tax=Polytolypa hystricis (strain UAMH7299) TaxID=1447883 RepID=A0A2B7YD20_POLH7|nr:hypothetical protein AJ80_04467 [Polytolypa hystricis UAMH7299]